MAQKGRTARHVLPGALLGLTLLATGCLGHHGHPPMMAHNVPHELALTSHPPHVIEPGDNLVLIMRSLPLPKPPYKIRILDQLRVSVANLPPRREIEDIVFIVEPEGVIRLATTGGEPLGSVQVLGLTLDEAARAIEEHLKKVIPGLKDPRAAVSLEAGLELEMIPDAALVRPNGTISLGGYGYIHVAGFTEQQAQKAIEEHLSEFMMKPEVVVEVSTENYTWFYLVVERSVGGESVQRVNLTGRETVLDVLSVIDGLPLGTNGHRIWVARPAPADAGCDQVLLVNWADIVQRGRTATNYQLLPGDRLYIKADPWIKAADMITKVTTPFNNIATFAQNMLSAEEQFRLAIGSGLFSSGFFGFGFPGFGF